MFNIESRYLLNLNVQKALDCISENFDLKIFHKEHAPETCSKSAPVRSPDGAPVLLLSAMSLGPLYHKILRPPLSYVIRRRESKCFSNTAQELPRRLPRFCHYPLVDFQRQCLHSMSPCIARTLGSAHKVGKDYWANELNLNV